MNRAIRIRAGLESLAREDELPPDVQIALAATRGSEQLERELVALGFDADKARRITYSSHVCVATGKGRPSGAGAKP
jgi:hypothetical protein